MQNLDASTGETSDGLSLTFNDTTGSPNITFRGRHLVAGNRALSAIPLHISHCIGIVAFLLVAYAKHRCACFFHVGDGHFKAFSLPALSAFPKLSIYVP